MMEREVVRRKIRSLKELREFVEEMLIDHSEQRVKAFYARHNEGYFYEQGWCDALKSIRDLIGKEGLLLYRYVMEEREEREEDKDRDIL